jgi:hypothetical protein
MRPATRARADGGRLLAITLAIALPLAGWVALEYRNEQQRVAAAALEDFQSRLPPAATHPAPAANAEATAPGTAPTPAQARQDLFKCHHSGKTIYTDQPERNCDGSADVTRVERSLSAGLSPDKPFQAQLAESEARNPAPAPNRSQTALISRHGERDAARCAANANAQESVKSALRQPHDAWRGDQLTQRLKQLTDEAFSLGC